MSYLSDINNLKNTLDSLISRRNEINSEIKKIKKSIKALDPNFHQMEFDFNGTEVRNKES